MTTVFPETRYPLNPRPNTKTCLLYHLLPRALLREGFCCYRIKDVHCVREKQAIPKLLIHIPPSPHETAHEHAHGAEQDKQRR